MTSEGVVRLGELLRRYHDAVRTFRPPEGVVWRNPLAPQQGELIRHGDFSPFTTTWLYGPPAGIIDWDFARPGNAIHDMAYLAWDLNYRGDLRFLTQARSGGERAGDGWGYFLHGWSAHVADVFGLVWSRDLLDRLRAASAGVGR